MPEYCFWGNNANADLSVKLIGKNNTFEITKQNMVSGFTEPILLQDKNYTSGE